jgi:hypothetical protein
MNPVISFEKRNSMLFVKYHILSFLYEIIDLLTTMENKCKNKKINKTQIIIIVQ